MAEKSFIALNGTSYIYIYINRIISVINIKITLNQLNILNT